MTSYDRPHRRFNPLSREWVLVSPHRARRPWLGQVEKAPAMDPPAYDHACYLCPGNERAGGRNNPSYTGAYVFDNDFPALLPFEPDDAGGSQHPILVEADGLLRMEPVNGVCRVMCFSPRHDLGLPRLPQPVVEGVVRTWAEQTRDLGSRPEIQSVQIFENKGEMMGASNPHPHSQIWSSSFIPNETQHELESQREYYRQHGSCLLCDYLSTERIRGDRIVATNDHFSALIPYWAVWPFEILVLSHRHSGALTDLNAAEVAGLADVLRQVTIRYDNLFEISFPYSMGFHQTPTDGVDRPEAHLHAHFNPPLLRSASVRKFMVGFEMYAMPQRDLTPETAAERLREVNAVHYAEAGEPNRMN